MKSVAVSCLCRMFPVRICCQSSTGACSTSWCCVGMVTWRGLGVGGFLEVSTAQGFPVRFWTHCGHQLHWSSQSRTPVQLCLLRKKRICLIFIGHLWITQSGSAERFLEIFPFQWIHPGFWITAKTVSQWYLSFQFIKNFDSAMLRRTQRSVNFLTS